MAFVEKLFGKQSSSFLKKDLRSALSLSAAEPPPELLHTSDDSATLAKLEKSKKRKREQKAEESNDDEGSEVQPSSAKRRKQEKKSKKHRKNKEEEEEQEEEDVDEIQASSEQDNNDNDEDNEEAGSEDDSDEDVDSEDEREEAFEEYRRQFGMGHDYDDESDEESSEESESDEHSEDAPDEKAEESGDEAESESESDSDEEESGSSKGKKDKSEKTENKKEVRPLTMEERLEQEKRTIFVGNLSVRTKKKKLKQIFKKYGEIESIRFRSIAFAKPGGKFLRKIEWKKKDFHPERDSMNAYIRFTTVEAAKAALAEHNTVINEKHIRVDMALGSKQDYSNTLFVGNLPYGAEEEDLYEIFNTQAGPVDSVRIIRDGFYKVAKGFAFVKMKSREAMEKAIALNGRVNYQGRILRITKAETEPKKLEKMKNTVAFYKRKRMKAKKSKQLAQKYKQKAKR